MAAMAAMAAIAWRGQDRDTWRANIIVMSILGVIPKAEPAESQGDLGLPGSSPGSRSPIVTIFTGKIGENMELHGLCQCRIV